MAEIRIDAPAKTALERNPFAVLGATLRDNRQRLVELAEQQALIGDEEEVNAARAAVTNPRTRLKAEVEWLPGTSPAKVTGLLHGLRKNPGVVRAARGLNPLTIANLMAAAIELVDVGNRATEWAEWMVALAEAEDDIDVEGVTRDINEDRAVAGFPEVRDVAAVEALLAERRRHYKDVTLAGLDRLPSAVLLEAVTTAVAEATANGERHAPLLIDEICAAYELRATAAIDQGAMAIGGIVKSVRSQATSGAKAVAAEIARLERAARQWDKLAQPVQLVMKSRGQDHGTSQRLAYEIRSLAVHLVNEHNLIDEGKRLTDLLADVFAELPEVVERLGEDSDALAGLMRQRDESTQRDAEWAREITYRAEIGLVFKDTLSLSPDGASWKGQHFPLESITRIRWGAVRRSVNGIPTGTDYTIGFGDNQREAVVETRQGEVFEAFTQKIYRAAGIRILVEMLKALGEGARIQFGDAVVDDNGVRLQKHAFFSNEPVYLRWAETHVWNQDGSFYVGSRTDKKVYSAMPYLHTDNVHFLEHAIRAFFKTSKARLSQTFAD